MNVALLGASNKPDRYAYKAFLKLRAAGHRVFPVHPQLQEIEGVAVYPSLGAIKEPIDTLSIYVSSARLDALIDDIITLAPRRIICNPGTENENLKARAQEHQIEVLEACTLVLLSTNQF